MDRPLRIAHCVESYAPALGGMPEVVKQLSERMAAMGHQVMVLTSNHPQRMAGKLNGVVIQGFDITGNAVDGIQGDSSSYLLALRTGGFDVVTFFAAQQWATDAALPHLAQVPAKKIFVPTGFSALHDPRWASYFAQMPGHMKRMDLNVVLSSTYQDARFAQAHGVTNLQLIPNGASAEEFDGPADHSFRAAQGIATDQLLVLHIGSYTGIKGHREAIAIFVKAKTGKAVLALVGNGNAKLKQLFHRHWRYFLLRWQARSKGKRVLFLELDRAATVEALKEADLFLFPSNVECSPIVLFEAMAAGVPFLSSNAGNAAEIAEWSLGGWTIPGMRDALQREHPNISRGAQILGKLLSDGPKRSAAGKQGHAAWRDRFTWQLITEQYVEAYENLLREAP
ncbi:MAG: glycosyltransferase family 4 protein [Bacteroidetes bacterium]|nr:glycosyltransferase family 4 protein [Bacteroidota bacterium]